MKTPLSPQERRDGLKNIVRNLAWILGGKGFAAVASLVYLALLSRSLGVRDFGHFSLIFSTAQALVALAGFQTWQTMIRVGARSAMERDWSHFGRLAGLCAIIDAGGALIGCILAVVLFYGFAEVLNLNPKFVGMAFWFSCALLWARMTTSNGIVRVLDRFDLGSYVEAVVPAGRLIAAVVIVFIGASVEKFLIAWALFDLLSAALYWVVAWKLVPQALTRANFARWREAIGENPGIKSFFGITYASSSLDALYRQGPLLLVGLLLGTSAAGLYKLADQLAQGIGTMSQLVARAVFPEFALSH
ncbi:oligosaccharide flippase family protein, partial [Tsuneonella sp. YG55]